MGDLTEHFSRAEFDAAGDAWPSTGAFPAQRLALAHLAEQFRTLAGNRPGVINSAFRSPAHNERVGGADHSEHMDGRALDVSYRGVRDSDFAAAVAGAVKANAIRFGQFITYDDTTHVHFSLPRTDGRPNNVMLRGLPKQPGKDRVYVALDARQIAQLATSEKKKLVR